MKGNAVSRSALFSKIIFKTCLLRESSVSSSMDRFLKKTEHKSTHEFTKRGQVVCVLGRSGIGKTWAVHDALEPCIEITPDILRSKQETLGFLERIQGTNTPVILDEYEVVQDLIGVREIKGPPTNGLFVIVSQIPVKFDFEIETYSFPVPTPEKMKELFPEATDDAIQKSKGDLRYVIQSLVLASDEKDEFMGARDFIESLVATSSDAHPMSLSDRSIHEPGNIMAILHENYVDSKVCDHARVIDTLSEACIFETKLYEGHWDLYDYYNFQGCFTPATGIGHTLKLPLRPGSVWTKHQSACARAKKLEALSKRVPGKTLSMDEVLILYEYAERNNLDVLREYNLKPQDLDVLNHLSPLRKIKAKTLASLKKSLNGD
jgi:hypothetical protein